MLSEADEVEIDIPRRFTGAGALTRAGLPARRGGARRRASTSSSSACGTPTPGPAREREAGGAPVPGGGRRCRSASRRRPSTSRPSPNVCPPSRGASAGSTKPWAALQRLVAGRDRGGPSAELEAGLRGLEIGPRRASTSGSRSEATRQRKDADDVGDGAARPERERSQVWSSSSRCCHRRRAGHDDQLRGGAVARRARSCRARGAEIVRRCARFSEKLLGRSRCQVEGPSCKTTATSSRPSRRRPSQGRREAEDIRSQIAPLLEERVRRHESDALLFSEMERLRESLGRVAPRPGRARPQQRPK